MEAKLLEQCRELIGQKVFQLRQQCDVREAKKIAVMCQGDRASGIATVLAALAVGPENVVVVNIHDNWSRAGESYTRKVAERTGVQLLEITDTHGIYRYVQAVGQSALQAKGLKKMSDRTRPLQVKRALYWVCRLAMFDCAVSEWSKGENVFDASPSCFPQLNLTLKEKDKLSKALGLPQTDRVDPELPASSTNIHRFGTVVVRSEENAG